MALSILCRRVVAELADDQIAFGVLVEAVGEPEVAGGGAEAAHVADPGAVGLEDAEAVVAGVGDVDEAVVDQHGLGARELAVALPEGAELIEEMAEGVEDLDAVVVAVLGDEDVALVVEGDVGGVYELTGTSAHRTPAAEFLALGRVDDDAVVMGVGDVDVVVAADGESHGLAEAEFGHAPAVEEFAVVVEMLDAGHAVDDEEGVVAWGVGDAAGVDDLAVARAGFEPDFLGFGGLGAPGHACCREGASEDREPARAAEKTSAESAKRRRDRAEGSRGDHQE